MKQPPKSAIIIRPSTALAIQYRGDLLPMVRAMAKEMHTEVMAIYRPYREMQRKAMVGDASVVALLTQAFQRLRARWLGPRQGDVAERTATAFVQNVDTHVMATFTRGLRDKYGHDKAREASGPVITPKRLKGADYQTTLEAAVADNVGLIKSIPSQYLEQVEREVMQAVQDGWPLDRLSSGLQNRYGITKRRAELIARDQCAKVTEDVKEKRAVAVGFTEATWWHSAGSRYPRKSHMAANGRRYKLSEGCLIDDEYIRPGQKVCCRCFCTLHMPGE